MATIFQVDGGVHLHNYCKDKAELVLISLARQADRLRPPEAVDATIKEQVLDDLYGAIIVAMRILAVSSEIAFTDADARTVFQEGLRGYQRLVRDRGFGSRILDRDLHNTEEKFLDFVSKLTPLLAGPRSNRTLIHQLLLNAPHEDRRVGRIADLTESLTMGALTWIDYQTQVRDLL